MYVVMYFIYVFVRKCEKSLNILKVLWGMVMGGGEYLCVNNMKYLFD